VRLGTWATFTASSSSSVVRPSLVVSLFFVGGQIFFYVFVLAANHLLDPIAFGRFYAAWAMLNVLVAPASVLSMVLMRYFAHANHSGGASAVGWALDDTLSWVVPWVAAITLAVVAALNLTGALIGIDSVALTLLVPITAAVVIVVEIARAAYQGMLRFVRFGLSWFTWCIMQCAFGIAGLALVGTVWAAYAGMLLASFATLFFLLIPFRSATRAQQKAARNSNPRRLEWQAALPFCTAFGGLVLFNNADIFVAYLTMDASNLGIYSAGAVLPKAILTATQPIVQTVFPVVVHLHVASRGSGRAVFKGVCLALVLAAAGGIFLWASGNLVCGGSVGIRFCNIPTMLILAVAAIPLSATRVWMTADLARHRFWLPHLPILVFAIFMATEGLQHPANTKLALLYATAAWAMLAITSLVKTWQSCCSRQARTAETVQSPACK